MEKPKRKPRRKFNSEEERQQAKKEYIKNWRLEHPNYDRERYATNEKYRNSSNEWRKKNPEKAKEQIIKFRKNNPNYYAKLVKERKRIDPLFKLISNIRCSIKQSLKRKKFNKNNSKTEQILGCTFEQFKQYIEKQFESWMRWENHGLYNKDTFNYGWDLDHIIPISSAKTKEDIIKLNHYTNFQPLCSKINRDIKRAKF